ncbi:UBR7 family protein [Megaselia abdita]
MAEETKATTSNDEVPEDPENNYVMLSDLIKEQEELEDQSIAVYGASDDKFCSYDNGYLKRQALFSCLTCCPKSADDMSFAAGVCLACSYKCHENHTLVELYTKRNFRCDCGTNKIPDSKCNLTKTKEGKLPINRDNLYNHNFQGLYCSCNRPYPDPDNDQGDDGDIMAQCTICEDWFHYGHLNTTIPDNADTFDLICEQCLKDHEFLQYYHKHSTKTAETSESDDKLRSDLDKSISDILKIEANESDQPVSKKIKLDESTELPSTSKDKDECILPSDKNGYESGAMFLPSSWRDLICKCPKCKDLYENQKLSFLLDPDDSQRLYEEKGIKKTENALESTLENLSQTSRVALVETIHEFHNMTGKLKEFLLPFMESKKVVTQDDINRFFEEMKNNRSKTTQPSTFCR